MTLPKSLLDFFTEPVDEYADEAADGDASVDTDSLAADAEEAIDNAERDVPADAEEDPDGDGQTPHSTYADPTNADGDAFDWADRRVETDEKLWPYSFTPNGQSITIGPDEVLHDDGTTEEGKEESFAGQWVREMFEAHQTRPNDNTWVGYTKDNVRGVQETGIEYKSLFRHIALFGTTGYGKSTVLKNLMVQWAFMGYGFCFIDPKGKDILDLVDTLPEERLDDIVWVEPADPESEHVVGFNFFDTYHSPGDPRHENEVSEIVSDFVSILKAGKDGWGATMDSVAEAVSRQLIRAEEQYTVLDMYAILAQEEEREKFAEMFGDEVESIYLDRLKEMDTEEIDPLLRRIQKWADTSTTRDIVAHRESTINISEVVEEGKILLVRTSNIPDNKVKSLVATSIVNRIWATIRTRADLDESEYDPFFCVMDEFDMLAKGNIPLNDMLSKGRAYEISVCLANQQPNQLPDDEREAIYNNCDNLLTFNPGPGNVQDAKVLHKTFGVEMMDLFELSQFEILGRFQVGTEKTPAILVQTFAPYPPRRTREVTKQIIEKSIERYGVKELDEESGDFSQYGLLAREREDRGEELIEVGDERLTTSQILEAVHTAGVRHGTRVINEKPGWVDIEGIREEAVKYSSTFESGSSLDNVLEQIPSTLREEATVGETTYYRLTTEGEEMAFVQDTGRSASGGKAGHRHLLKKGYEAFTQLGYDVKLPTQEGGEQPDGVANPPIKPVQESDSFEEAKRLEDELKQKYPRLQELFDDNDVALEAESTTITKPKQTVKNLAKAMENDQKCVFLVKDGEESKGTFEYWARAGYRVLTDPPFVSYKDSEGNRRYYNYASDSPVSLSNGGYALRESSKKDNVWRDDGDRIVLENPENKLKHKQTDVKYTYSYNKNGEIILRDPDGNEYNKRFSSWDELVGKQGEFEETQIPLAIFKDWKDLENPSHTKFPFHYEYNQADKQYTVQDSNGNDIDVYEDKSDMLDDYDIVPQPLIPESMFPGGEYPDKDDWMFVIIPDADKDSGPQIYRGEDSNGESILEPLFENDDPYDAIKNESLPQPTKDNVEADESEESESVEKANDPTADPDKPDRPTGLTNDSQTEDTEGDDEPKVASGDNPKSNTEIVKESDEVWTKPDPDDDDYDPSKDNSKFHTGYDEEGVGEDWDGGRAREMDDGTMDGYKTPEEKEDEKLKEEYKNREKPDSDTDSEETHPEEDNAEDPVPEDEANSSTDSDSDQDESEKESSGDPLQKFTRKRNKSRKKKSSKDEEE